MDLGDELRQVLPQRRRSAGLLQGPFLCQAYAADICSRPVIFFAVASAYFIGVFRLGSGWLLVVLGICAQYYVLSISRVRRSARDDIQRELVKTRLVTESESADWINSFLARFWRIYVGQKGAARMAFGPISLPGPSPFQEPILSATIVASVDAVLSTSTPAFLESIKMTTFTLGNKVSALLLARGAKQPLTSESTRRLLALSLSGPSPRPKRTLSSWTGRSVPVA